jgi:hypothetical protein
MKERRYTVQYDGPWGQHVHVITKSAGFNSQWWMYDDHSDYHIDEVPNVICIARNTGSAEGIIFKCTVVLYIPIIKM